MVEENAINQMPHFFMDKLQQNFCAIQRQLLWKTIYLSSHLISIYRLHLGSSFRKYIIFSTRKQNLLQPFRLRHFRAQKCNFYTGLCLHISFPILIFVLRESDILWTIDSLWERNDRCFLILLLYFTKSLNMRKPRDKKAKGESKNCHEFTKYNTWLWELISQRRHLRLQVHIFYQICSIYHLQTLSNVFIISYHK